MKSYQRFQHWYFSSYPTGCLAFYCQSWDWLARWSHTSDFNIGTSAVTLPGAWRFTVRAGTGWPGGVIPAISTLVLQQLPYRVPGLPGVSQMSLGGIESLIYSLYLRMAACHIADPSMRYTNAEALTDNQTNTILQVGPASREYLSTGGHGTVTAGQPGVLHWWSRYGDGRPAGSTPLVVTVR